MQTNAIVEMVERASLWRSDPASWTASDPDLALATRTGVLYRPRVLQAPPAPGVHTLTGPRRAGKTVASLLRVQELLDTEAFRPEAVVRASLDTFDKDDLVTLLTSQQVADQLGLPQEGPRLWVLDAHGGSGERIREFQPLEPWRIYNADGFPRTSGEAPPGNPPWRRQPTPIQPRTGRLSSRRWSVCTSDVPCAGRRPRSGMACDTT